MTLGAIKQALREVKEICNGCENCDDCPISNEMGDCSLVGPDLNIVYPFHWPLDWKEDDPMICAGFKAYQECARHTSNTYTSTDKIQNALLGLSGEVCELCDHYKKHKFQGHAFDRDHMIEEAGDVLWYLSELADGLDISLEDIAIRNIEKLARRYPDGFDPERSMHREGQDEDHH